MNDGGLVEYGVFVGSGENGRFADARNCELRLSVDGGLHFYKFFCFADSVFYRFVDVDGSWIRYEDKNWPQDEEWLQVKITEDAKDTSFVDTKGCKWKGFVHDLQLKANPNYSDAERSMILLVAGYTDTGLLYGTELKLIQEKR